MGEQRSVDERLRLVEEHRAALRDLEDETWPDARRDPPDFYWIWHLVVGLTLGGLGASVSLALNYLGATILGKPGMQLIRVYLTFPMGERALVADEGTVLTVGALLYIGTGALYGVVFHLLMRRFRDASWGFRFGLASAFGLAIWIVNFYLVLSWLQPLLLGGNWIVRLVPIWVAAATHLAFVWTMFMGEPWGRFRDREVAAR